MTKVKKVSDNPRYYSTGKKLDIKTETWQYQEGWLPREEYFKKRKQAANVKLGVTPNAWQLSVLEELYQQGNAVAAGIQGWLEQHGVLTLSQLAYLNKAVSAME